MSRYKSADSIPDSVLLASWRPGDGSRHGSTSMICLDCENEFVQHWEREYGQICPKEEECPKCGSSNIEEGGTAEPDEPDWDTMAELKEEARRERAERREDEDES